MEECSEVFHKPKDGGSIRSITVRSTEDRETYYPSKKPALHTSKTKLNIPSQAVIPFKLHTNETTPWSLLRQVTSFVAFHAEFIESLVDFPTDVAKIIWDECIKTGKLDPTNNIDSRLSILSTFCEAFPEEMLSSCKVTNLELVNNFDDELNIILAGVTNLNLDGCLLGDEHDLIRGLLKMCNNLESLSLAGNELSNKGLRNLFLFHKKVDVTIKYLDLSGNPKISAQGLVNYVQPVESVNKIVLSTTMLDSEKLFDQIVSTKSDFRRKNRPDVQNFVTIGWVSDLFKKWEAFLEERRKAKTPKRNSTFYSVKKVEMKPIDSNPIPNVTKIMYERSKVKSPPNKRAKIETTKDDNDDFDQILLMYKKK